MSDFKGLDRSNTERVPGELLKLWTAETKALKEKIRRELTCPHCGFLMATGVPCGPPAAPNGGDPR